MINTSKVYSPVFTGVFQKVFGDQGAAFSPLDFGADLIAWYDATNEANFILNGVDIVFVDNDLLDEDFSTNAVELVTVGTELVDEDFTPNPFTPIVGTELIDEDFSTDPGWVVSGNAVVANGKLVSTTVTGGQNQQSQTFTPGAGKEVWMSFDMEVSGLSLPSNDNRLEGSGMLDGSGGTRFVIGPRNQSGVNKWFINWTLDTTSNSAFATTPFVEGETIKVVLHWISATAPAANDGIVQCWINDVLEVDLSNQDTDTFDMDRVIGGSNSSSGTVDGVIKIDNVKAGTSGTAPVWFSTGNSVVIGGQLVSTKADGDANVNSRTSFTVQTEVWAKYDLKISSVVIPNNFDNMQGGGLNLGASTRRQHLGIRRNGSGVVNFFSRYETDTTNVQTDIASPAFVDGQTYTISVHWKAATAPAADDGIIQIWIDENLVLDVSDADTDTLTVDTVLMGTQLNSINDVSGIWTNDNLSVGTTGALPSWTKTLTGSGFADISNGQFVFTSDSGDEAFVTSETVAEGSEKWAQAVMTFDSGFVIGSDGTSVGNFGLRRNAFQRVVIGLINDSGTIKFRTQINTDSGLISVTHDTPVFTPTKTYTVVTQYLQGTGGLDGGGRVFIDGDLVRDSLDLDNNSLGQPNNIHAGMELPNNSVAGTVRFDSVKIGATGFAQVPGLIDEDFSTDPGWTVTGDAVVTGGQLIATMDNAVANQIESFTTTDEAWSEFVLSITGVSLASNGDEIRGTGILRAGSSRLSVGLINDSGTIKFLITHRIDGSTIKTTISSVAFLENKTYTIVLHHFGAANPGDNDGIVEVWINNIKVMDLSGLDNDTVADIAQFVGGTVDISTNGQAVFAIDDVKVGLTGFDPTAVVQWTDLSLNSNHLTQTTEVDQPLYDNVVKSVEFDGVSAWLDNVFSLKSPPFTLGLVFEYDVNATDYVVDGVGTDNGVAFLIVNSNFTIFAGLSFMEGSAANLDLHTMVAEYNNTLSENFLDGVDDNVSPKNGTDIMTGITIGINSGQLSSFNFNGRVKSYVLIDRVLSIIEKNQLGNFLSNVNGSPWTNILPFSPLDLNPEAMFDASDAGDFTFSSGAIVSQWDDLSGNGNHATEGDTGLQPTHVVGSKLVAFDGSGDVLSGSYSGINQPNTLIVVGNWDVAGTGTYISGSANGSFRHDLISSTNFTTFAGSNFSSGLTSNTSEHIFICLYNFSNSRTIIDGTTDITGDPGGEGNTGFKMGARDDEAAGQSANCNIKFWMMVPRELTTTEINDLGNYLANRFSQSWTDV